MEYSGQFYKTVFENTSNTYVIHKVITDESNCPVDFEFVDANLQFENFIGLKRDNLLGSNATEVLLEMVKSDKNWIEFYAKAALNREKNSFIQYSVKLGKWYLIYAFPLQESHFITIFNDITDLKIKENYFEKQATELLEMEEKIRVQYYEQKSINELVEISEERLKQSQGIAHVGSWELDIKDNTVWASDEAYEICGIVRKSDLILFKQIHSLINMNDRHKLEEAFNLLINKNDKFDIEFRVLRANDGEERVLHANAERKLDESGSLVKIIGVIQDITDRKRAEMEIAAINEELIASEDELRKQYDRLQLSQKALIESEDRFRATFEQIALGICHVSLDGKYLRVNRKFCEIVGYKRNELLGMTFKDITPKEEWQTNIDLVKKAKMNEIKAYSLEKRYIRKDGSIIWANLTISSVNENQNNESYLIVVVEDISGRKKADEHINFLAYNDAVTGLSNRTLFISRLERAVSSVNKGSLPGAVFFLDLDDFKKINDTYGHSTGDKLLKEIGIKIKNYLREYDTIARIGGDEFTILLTNIEKYSSVLECANRTIKIFNNQWDIDGHEIFITASMGITVFPNDGKDVRELMKNADTAMYNAKEKGKNNYQFFEKSMLDKLMYKVDIEKELRNALNKDELVIYYQPQIDISTGKIACMEALLRWNHPKRGFMLPNRFIQIAEESSIILRIGEWVLREACYQNMQWQKDGAEPFIICVNISLAQLQDNAFVKMTKGILKETGLDPKYLEIEITETLLMESLEYSLKKLQELKKIGVKISLDDFGKGYSSLNYLRLLPLDTLKIDKSFIDDIEKMNENQLFIKQIIEIAHVLKLNVTAEGVETERQFEYLKKEKCDMVQGLFFSKPLPLDKVQNYINKIPIQQ